MHFTKAREIGFQRAAMETDEWGRACAGRIRRDLYYKHWLPIVRGAAAGNLCRSWSISAGQWLFEAGKTARDGAMLPSVRVRLYLMLARAIGGVRISQP